MGGNAISNTIRLQAVDYYNIRGVILEQLNINFKSKLFLDIDSYRDKESFGDLDILHLPLSEKEWEMLFDILDVTEIVKNGPCTSVGVKSILHPDKNFQVDFITCKDSSEYLFSYHYFSFNDLGNLIGRVAKKIGFKLAHNGFYYVLRAPNTRIIKTIKIKCNWFEALEFLGYSKYDSFDSLEDIFKYVTSSIYFSKDIYLLKNRNHRDRTRDRKRKTYMAFLKWLDEKCNKSNSLNPEILKNCRPKFLEKAFKDFEGFQAEYNSALEQYEISEKIKKKFNGKIVMELTGLEGKKLGGFMIHLKSANRDFLNMTPKDINNYILCEFKNYE